MRELVLPTSSERRHATTARPRARASVRVCMPAPDDARAKVARARAALWYTQPCLYLRVPAARLSVYLYVIVCILV